MWVVRTVSLGELGEGGLPGQPGGRCSTRRRAERASLAGMVMSWARIVPEVARAWKVEASVHGGAGEVERHRGADQPGGVGPELPRLQVREWAISEVGDDLLHDRVPAVRRLRRQHRQVRVRQHGVVPVDGEQRVLVGRVDVGDAPHDQPHCNLLVLGSAAERGELDLRDFGLRNLTLLIFVVDGVGVRDRRPGGSGNSLDRTADRGKQPGGDGEPGPVSEYGCDDVGLVVGRVHPRDQGPGRAGGLRGDEGVGDEPVCALRAVGLAAAQPDSGELR